METLAQRVSDLLALAQESDYTDGELHELASRLSTAHEAIERLRELADMLSMEIAARVEEDLTPVPGVGTIQRGYTRRSQWRDTHSAQQLRYDLGEAVSSAVSMDVATGELDPMKRNVARAVVSALWECLPAFSGIKQPANRYGIRISDYRTYNDVPVVSIAKEAPTP